MAANSANGVKTQSKQERLGKKLCYLLRYGAEREGLEVRPDGFVLLEELLTVPLLGVHSNDEITSLIDSSISMRGIPRFEKFSDFDGRVMVRATYGRRMERSQYHPETKVQRLLDRSVDVVAANIQLYDMDEFQDDYVLNLIMRRMRRTGKLSNKALRQFLVRGLIHLDFWSVYVTESTLKYLPRSCPNLKSLGLRDCGYVVTDNLLGQILKGLHEIESLNLLGCHHLTNKSIVAIQKNCPKLRHLNLTFVSKISPDAIICLISSCTFLEELNMYDYKDFTQENLEIIYSVTEGRKFRLEIPAKNAKPVSQTGGQIHDSVFERPNYR